MARVYHSPLREAQAGETRAKVLAAAGELFVTRGWGGTSVRDVAGAAGVSVETVYSSVGGKAQLLKQALDVAVVGDTAEVPLSERPEFVAIGAGDTLEGRARAAGRFLASMHRRTARLRRVLVQAAGGDAELAAQLARDRVDERESVRQGVVAVARRPLADEVVDGLFAILSSETFLLLVEDRRWSVATYERWAAHVVGRLVDTEGSTA